MNLRRTFALLTTILALSLATAQAQTPLKIWCVGASITMGQGVNGGYRLPLEKMLEGAGIPVQFVGRIDWNSKGMTSPNHDGYPGHRVDQIENGATNQFKITSQPIAEGAKALNPDVILLICGTNDVRQNYKLDEAPARLDHLIGTLIEHAPQAKILVGSITPDLHFDDAVRRYNSGVAAVVAKRAAAGQKVAFVDQYAAVNSGTDISSDRTHPTIAGYTKIARTWFNVLAPKVAQPAFAVSPEGANEFISQTCLGYQITTKKNLTISDLGIYIGGNTLTAKRAVGVFSTEGKELARAEIGPEASVFGRFAYAKLATPLKLDSGKSYIFVSNSSNLPALVGTAAIVDPVKFDDPRFYFDHNVAVNIDATDTTTLKFPGIAIRDINGALGYFGPTFRIQE